MQACNNNLFSNAWSHLHLTYVFFKSLINAANDPNHVRYLKCKQTRAAYSFLNTQRRYFRLSCALKFPLSACRFLSSQEPFWYPTWQCWASPASQSFYWRCPWASLPARAPCQCGSASQLCKVNCHDNRNKMTKRTFKNKPHMILSRVLHFS